jgi:hypothetical protein
VRAPVAPPAPPTRFPLHVPYATRHYALFTPFFGSAGVEKRGEPPLQDYPCAAAHHSLAGPQGRWFYARCITGGRNPFVIVRVGQSAILALVGPRSYP